MLIKDVFEAECPRLKIDSKWATDVQKFEKGYVFSRQENLEFLGAGLMGTPRLIFSNAWRHQFFDDIVKCDDDVMLKDAIHQLPHIDPTRRVSTDPFNLSVVWLIHKTLTSKLPARQQEDTVIALLKIVHYKFLSSLMSHYFPYEPDRATMEATYYALNRKYSLKQHGSWSALITSRAKDIVSQSSIHRKTLERMDNDDKVQYVVTDVQGRIREVVKKMYLVFIDVHETQAKMLKRRSTMELDGEVKVRDMLRKETAYIRYIKDTMQDKSSLIKEELLNVVLSLVTTTSERDLRLALDYMVDNYGTRGDKGVEKLTEVIMHHAFVYMRAMRQKQDLANMLSDLRSLYMSSRTSNEHVLEMRDLGIRIVARATNIKNSSSQAAVRTALMLYVVLRAFTKDHYSQGGTLEDIY